MTAAARPHRKIKSLDLGGRRFEIGWPETMDKDRHGSFTPTSSPPILCEKKPDVGEEIDVLVHESLHAMLYQARLSFSEDGAEERLVSGLTPLLISWLAQNPKMIESIQAGSR